MKRHTRLLTFFALSALGAQAGLITSAPAGATTTVFAGGAGCGGSTDAGFAVSGSACWNYSGYFGFGQNGAWNNPPSGFGLIGGNTTTSSFTINLGGLYSSVGGFINYDNPIAGGSDSSSDSISSLSVDDPMITAIGADGHTVLGTYDISVLDPISTPSGVNAGAFVGIQDATNDIAYLELSNDYTAIHSITVGTTGTSETPEPSSFLLLGSGLVLACVLRTRRVCS